MSVQILPGMRISWFQHFKLLSLIFSFGKSRMPTGNTISLTNFNETFTKRLLSPALQLENVSLKYCGPFFQKWEFMIINFENIFLSEIKIAEVRMPRKSLELTNLFIALDLILRTTLWSMSVQILPGMRISLFQHFKLLFKFLFLRNPEWPPETRFL